MDMACLVSPTERPGSSRDCSFSRHLGPGRVSGRYFKHFKECRCILPDSEPEQAKIAEILLAVDRAIEQSEGIIAKQQRIKTGLMQDLLTGMVRVTPLLVNGSSN